MSPAEQKERNETLADMAHSSQFGGSFAGAGSTSHAKTLFETMSFCKKDEPWTAKPQRRAYALDASPLLGRSQCFLLVKVLEQKERKYPAFPPNTK